MQVKHSICPYDKTNLDHRILSVTGCACCEFVCGRVCHQIHQHPHHHTHSFHQHRQNCDYHTAHVDQKPPGVVLCFHLPPEGVVPTLYKTRGGKKKVKTVVCPPTKCLGSVETADVHLALSPMAPPLMHLRFERWLHLSQSL